MGGYLAYLDPPDYSLTRQVHAIQAGRLLYTKVSERYVIR